MLCWRRQTTLTGDSSGISTHGCLLQEHGIKVKTKTVLLQFRGEVLNMSWLHCAPRGRMGTHPSWSRGKSKRQGRFPPPALIASFGSWLGGQRSTVKEYPGAPISQSHTGTHHCSSCQALVQTKPAVSTDLHTLQHPTDSLSSPPTQIIPWSYELIQMKVNTCKCFNSGSPHRYHVHGLSTLHSVVCHIHTDTYPHSTDEKHNEMLISANGVCSGSYFSTHISSIHTAFGNWLFLAQLTIKSCWLLPHNLSKVPLRCTGRRYTRLNSNKWGQVEVDSSSFRWDLDTKWHTKEGKDGE